MRRKHYGEYAEYPFLEIWLRDRGCQKLLLKSMIYALKVLSEKNSLPMFLSTSDMVKQTPICISHPVDDDSSEVNARLKVIEESLNSIMTFSNPKNENEQNVPSSILEETSTGNTNGDVQVQQSSPMDVHGPRLLPVTQTHPLQHLVMITRMSMIGQKSQKDLKKVSLLKPVGNA